MQRGGGGGADGSAPTRPKRGSEPVHYHEYLKLDKLLDCCVPKSLEVSGHLAHDEVLFITTHQTYELWFKQILHEIDSCATEFSVTPFDARNLHTIVLRLKRIVEIQKVLVQQIEILETMTPLSFLDFRDYLFPASGFQSFQFRMVENKLGLRPERRLKYAKESYHCALRDNQKDEVLMAEEEPSVLALVEQWLERMPFLEFGEWDFVREYKKTIDAMIAEDRAALAGMGLEGDELAQREKDVDAAAAMYNDFLDEEKFDEAVSTGKQILSRRATMCALMINLYRDEPLFQVPYAVLTALMDIDTLMARWRYRHALMVQRMLGMRTGTGGSSGFHYLKATAQQHKVFSDLSNLSMYLLPQSALPALPEDIIGHTRFTYEELLGKKTAQ